MAPGTVKWFSDAKGYGFIEPDGEAGKDIFAHFSAIQMEGFRTLRMGSRVSYELHDGPKGPHALNIAPLPGEEQPEPPASTREDSGPVVLDPAGDRPAMRDPVEEGVKPLQF